VISKISKGISNKLDASLMSDLKRMSDLGVLEIHTTQPILKILIWIFQMVSLSKDFILKEKKLF
jgi:hypothetical protein